MNWDLCKRYISAISTSDLKHSISFLGVPRWALNLFDWDGCTTVTRTSNLHVASDENIVIGSVLRFRHLRDVYLVEILALAGN